MAAFDGFPSVFMDMNEFTGVLRLRHAHTGSGRSSPAPSRPKEEFR